MTQTTSKPTPTPQAPAEPEPAWEIARLFPDQGYWSEGDYLTATERTNRLVEFIDGYVEVLPMPKTSQQRILSFLNRALTDFVQPRQLGEALFAALRVRLRAGLIREPDIVFMLAQHTGRIGEDFWDSADLVMEIVSDDPGSRLRDIETK
jgi:Uma2 family endonuclease